jgi:hypothetical protein
MLTRDELAGLIEGWSAPARWANHERAADEQFIRDFLAHKSVKAAAAASGVTPWRAYRLLHDYRLVAKYVMREKP